MSHSSDKIDSTYKSSVHCEECARNGIPSLLLRLNPPLMTFPPYSLPTSVSSMELHGTGTPLGDPIEVGAAAAVLLLRKDKGEGTVRTAEEAPYRTQVVSFSAVKSKMGHSEAGAGVMGLAHAVLGIGAR